MVLPVTLADLAAAQAANPSNPYTNPPTEAEKNAAYMVGINSPPTHHGAVLGREPPPTAPVAPPLYSGGGIDQRVMDPSRNGATNAYATSRSDGKESEPLVTTGVGSGEPAGPSAERQHLADSNAVSEQIGETYQQDKQTNHDIQTQLKTGIETGKQAQQYADSINELNNVQAKLDHFQAESMAKEKSRQLQQEVDEARAMKVDPNHFFKERGVAGSLLAAISIGAGAFAAAMPHTANHENYALKIIDGAIERDVNAQRDEIANKWKTINYQGDKNQQEYVRSQYELAQRDNAREKDYLHAKGMVADIRANTSDTVAVMNLNKVDTDLDRKVAELRQKRLDHGLVVTLKERADAKAAASAANSGPMSAKGLEKRFAEVHDKWLLQKPEDRGPEPMEADFLNHKPGTTASEGGGSSKGATLGQLASMTGDVSTNWEFWRGLQGTSAFNNKLVHERWNTQIKNAVHQANPAARGLDALNELSEAYLIKPGDSQDTINKRVQSGLADFKVKSGGSSGVPGATPVGR